MKKVSGLAIATFLFLLCLSSSFCDSMTMKDNRSYPRVQVDSIVAGTSGLSFNIRMITDGRVEDQAYPVQESQIQKIQFNPAGADPAQTMGRSANLVFSDGRRFDGVTLVTFEMTPEESIFTVRQAGSSVADQAYPVPCSTIAEIQLLSGSQPTPSPTDDLSALMPGFVASVATPTPVSEEEKEPEEPGVVDDRLDQIMEKMEKNIEKQEEKESRKTAGQKLMDNLTIWLITTLISASLGGIVVFLVMKNKGEPVTWGKALLTGVLLAIIPGLVFKVCVFFAFGCFTFILAIMAWFYTARTIAMSVLDIQSPTATTIVIVWFFFYIVVMIGVAFAIAGTMLLKILSG
ncbi:hypothetical protein JW926_00270 [Candidatus Sumerlaeota bacterium]|nr:hypothetical protein [Candidatus Sumerlaeota bacterium]